MRTPRVMCRPFSSSMRIIGRRARCFEITPPANAATIYTCHPTSEFWHTHCAMGNIRKTRTIYLQIWWFLVADLWMWYVRNTSDKTESHRSLYICGVLYYTMVWHTHKHTHTKCICNGVSETVHSWNPQRYLQVHCVDIWCCTLWLVMRTGVRQVRLWNAQPQHNSACMFGFCVYANGICKWDRNLKMNRNVLLYTIVSWQLALI